MCGSSSTTLSRPYSRVGTMIGIEYTQLGGGLNAFLVPQKATEGTEGLGSIYNAGLHLSNWAAIAGDDTAQVLEVRDNYYRDLPRSKRDGLRWLQCAIWKDSHYLGFTTADGEARTSKASLQCSQHYSHVIPRVAQQCHVVSVLKVCYECHLIHVSSVPHKAPV